MQDKKNNLEKAFAELAADIQQLEGTIGDGLSERTLDRQGQKLLGLALLGA
jgi:hypothetical protein